jgi:IS5 family transposase
MRRRSAIEPVIGHTKNEHRMDCNYLAGRNGDANNAILAAAGYNFRRLIRWLSDFLRLLLAMLFLSVERLAPAPKEPMSWRLSMCRRARLIAARRLRLS